MRSVSVLVSLLLLAVLSAAQSQPIDAGVAVRKVTENIETVRILKEKQKDVGADGDHRVKVEESESSTSKKWVIPVAVTLPTLAILGGILFCFCRRRKRKAQEGGTSSSDRNTAENRSNKNNKLNRKDTEDEEIEVGEV